MQPKNTNLKTIIVDDELSGRESLNKILTTYSQGYDVLGIASSAEEGEQLIKSHKPDLVFADIEMPIKSGLEMLNSALEHQQFLIVLTTAHEQYAIKAINKFDIVGYLLKPIDIDEFRHIEKKIFAKANLGIEQKTLPSAPSNSTNGPSILFLPKLGGKEAINIEDIIYCKASNNYTEIILKGKIKKVISKTLKATESMLVDFPYFYRVHDSYLVNYRCIEEFRNEGEGGMLNLTEGHSVDISKRRKADFLLFLKSTGVKFN